MGHEVLSVSRDAGRVVFMEISVATRNEVVKALKRLGSDERSELYHPMLFIWGCTVVGCNDKLVAQWSKIGLTECSQMLQTAIDNGIVSNSRITTDVSDAVELVADAMVLAGQLVKSGNSYSEAKTES